MTAPDAANQDQGRWFWIDQRDFYSKRTVVYLKVLLASLTVEQATAVIDALLSHPTARVLLPGEDHWRILKSLVTETGTAGNLTTDAHLAALAIEHGATLSSTDTDFHRFRHLRWMNPIQDVSS